MRLISDVHGATEALRKVAAEPGPLLILGDLINFIDYRNYEGIVADVAGREFVAEMVALRTVGGFDEARRLWRDFSRGREEDLREQFDGLVDEAYREVFGALVGAEAFVTYGNADRPDLLKRHLPEGNRFLDADVVEIEGLRVGFAGGGLATPLGVPGEVTDEEMREKLDGLGRVDILCTHVPPAVDALSIDVIGGRQKGSSAVLDFLLAMRPSHHYFGDIHQPQAVSWRVGETWCRNVGYFRATGKAVRHG